MLVLSRKADTEICIGDDVVITVLSVRGDTVKIGIKAPREVTVHRGEVRDRIEAERKSQNTDDTGQE